MFKAINPSRPWPTTGLTTQRWIDEVGIELVRISDLIATQNGVYLHALMADFADPYSHDPYPHVISWGGELWLEDGHHRVIRDIMQGRTSTNARVFVL
jgi:hypothetical protein